MTHHVAFLHYTYTRAHMRVIAENASQSVMRHGAPQGRSHPPGHRHTDRLLAFAFMRVAPVQPARMEINP